MKHQINFLAKRNVTPSKGMIVVAFACALGLSISIFRTITKHTTRFDSTRQETLSLPELDEDKESVDENGDDEHDNGWKIIKTQSGDTLGRIFQRLGLSQTVLQSVLYQNPHARELARLKPDQELQFLIDNQVLEKLIFPLNPTQFLMVYRENNRYLTKINDRPMDVHNQYLTARVNGSLYYTAKQMNIPYKLIQQMMEIFNWEIDFSKDIRSGDQFSMIYKGFFIGDSQVGTGEILAVTYTNRGQIHQAIRHENNQGDSGYYTPQGTSLKKAFSRYPVRFSHISSSFSLSRKHPILHYSRPHKGVDLAAPIGTPIHATGDGRVISIGHRNDYGNMIKLSHNKTYESIYGHLLRFQKGLTRGDYVKRGQIIGYVGQSGLATGPHCHYEFHMNHQPKNPTTIPLPRAASIPAREMASFRSKSGTLLAHLKLFEEGQMIAANDKKSPVG